MSSLYLLAWILIQGILFFDKYFCVLDCFFTLSFLIAVHYIISVWRNTIDSYTDFVSYDIQFNSAPVALVDIYLKSDLLVLTVFSEVFRVFPCIVINLSIHK